MSLLRAKREAVRRMPLQLHQPSSTLANLVTATAAAAAMLLSLVLLVHSPHPDDSIGEARSHHGRVLRHLQAAQAGLGGVD